MGPAGDPRDLAERQAGRPVAAFLEQEHLGAEQRQVTGPGAQIVDPFFDRVAHVYQRTDPASRGFGRSMRKHPPDLRPAPLDRDPPHEGGQPCPVRNEGRGPAFGETAEIYELHVEAAEPFRDVEHAALEFGGEVPGRLPAHRRIEREDQPAAPVRARWRSGRGLDKSLDGGGTALVVDALGTSEHLDLAGPSLKENIVPPRDERNPASPPVPVAGTPAALRQQVAAWRHTGDSVALVPTMGALHAGHLALVAAGRAEARRTVVSIFVNPAQFAPTEDLDRYPRTFEADRALLGEAGADLIYAPAVGDMYPSGFAVRVEPGGPAHAGLEDAARPHFFGGVATVVTKLLLQALPDVATFGEKDYQQLQVVRATVRDLDIPVRIRAVETVREPDGLALSSRNRFLTADERHRAAALHAALSQAAAAIRAGVPIEAAVAGAHDTVISIGAALDYLEARHAETLAPVQSPSDGPLRLLVAARLGAVRLIDNMAV